MITKDENELSSIVSLKILFVCKLVEWALRWKMLEIK